MLSAPELLTNHHSVEAFACGESVLDVWLRRRALANQQSGASRTYVVCDDNEVVGFYSLAVGAVSAKDATGSLRRNMPDPVPMILLGRLAVDQNYHGRGIGRGLLKDAITRTLQAAATVGIRGMFVHALSEDAKNFYKNAGFRESPVYPMLLMVGLREVGG